MPQPAQTSIDTQIAAEMVPGLVEIHLLSFRNFFLTFLGPAFLRELYGAIVADPSGIGCVAWSEGRVSGFAIGTSHSAGLYARLLRRRWWRFGLAALPAFIRRPSILPRLLRAFSMPGQEPSGENNGTLMSIAVHPAFQGQGVGAQLVGAFLQEAAVRGLDGVDLTTDALENEPANRFYQGLGFGLKRSYVTPEGRKMNEYLIRFPQAAAGGEESAGLAA